MLYADANADAPVLPEALKAWVEAAADFANPSSAHALGKQARARLDEARRSIAASLGAAPGEVVLTSGGTEADALALLGVLSRRDPRGAHVVTTSLEHAAVQKTLASLAKAGRIELTVVAAPRSGRIDPGAVLAAVRPETVLVSMVLACNETGVLQPVAEVARALAGKQRRPIVHTDAVQAVGRVPVSFAALGVDLLSLAGHKLGALGGTGALLVRAGVELLPQLVGGGQEHGRRSGTEDVAGACALAAALSQSPASELAGLRDRLERGLAEAIVGLEILGAAQPRLPHTSCVRFPGCEADGLMMALDLQGICASTGSACASGSIEASPILMGMGLEKAEARQCLRFSLVRGATGDEVERVVRVVSEVYGRARTP